MTLTTFQLAVALSLRIMTVWRIREKSLWSSTTATSHANRKVRAELTIRTFSSQIPRLLHFSLKFLGGRCSFWRWLLKIKKDLCRHGWHAFAYYIFIFLIFDEITCILSSSFVIFCFEFQRAWIWFFFF